MWDELIENFDMSIDQADIFKMEEKKIVEKLRKFRIKKFREEKLKNEDLQSYLDYIVMLKLIERLQKENKELKEYIKILGKKNKILKHLYDDCCICLVKSEEKLDEQRKENFISKQKIKDLILAKKEEIVKNNTEIDECRKTILEEQTLKQLRLMVLHRKNEILFEQIADLQELLHY